MINDTPQVKFELVAWDKRQIDVLWVAEFGATGTPVHQWLAEQLELLRGVNAVVVNRYQAIVATEPRVRPVAEILDEIRILLAEDPDLLYLVRQELPRAEVVVTLLVR